MYEIWSLGHKPFENYTNNEVSAVAKIERLSVGYIRFPWIVNLKDVSNSIRLSVSSLRGSFKSTVKPCR